MKNLDIVIQEYGHGVGWEGARRLIFTWIGTSESRP